MPDHLEFHYPPRFVQTLWPFGLPFGKDGIYKILECMREFPCSEISSIAFSGFWFATGRSIPKISGCPNFRESRGSTDSFVSPQCRLWALLTIARWVLEESIWLERSTTLEVLGLV